MAKTIDIDAYIKTVAYTKAEVDSLLAGKAAAVHSHDDLYYTQDEIDSQLATINGSITDNVDALTTAINGKSDSDHDHDSDYAPLSHNHTKSQITDFAHGHEPADVVFTTGADASKNLTQKIGEIDSAIAALQSADWDIQIVTSLPSAGTAGTLYFLHDTDESTSGANSFDEYIYDATNERFEKIGQRSIDLSNYVTDVDLELSQAGVLSVSLTKGTSAFGL